MVEELRQKHGLWGVNLQHHRMARSEVERAVASKSLWVSLWFVQDVETARRWPFPRPDGGWSEAR